MQFHEHPHEHPHHHEHVLDRRSALRLGGLGLGGMLLAACAPSKSAISSTSTELTASSTTVAVADITSTIAATTTSQPEQATTTSTIAALKTLPGFDEFASTVKVFASGDYWQVESNGLPAHNMM
ncbi:MAG: hypothetical protein RIS46_132, partial [Actinomycetota bacterium]